MAKPTIICNVENTQAATVPALPSQGKYEVKILTDNSASWIFANIEPSEGIELKFNGAKSMLYFDIPEENSGTYTITGQTFVGLGYVNIDWQLTHAKLKSVENNIPDSFSCTLEADEGYKFVNAKIEDEYGASANFVIEDAGKHAKIENFEGDAYSYTMTISGEVVADVATEQITIKQTLTNCTSNAPGTINKGQTLNVTLTAEEGAKFQDRPKLQYTGSSGQSTDYFDISQETKATISFDTNKVSSGDITITGAAVKEQITGRKYGTIGVYVITMDDIEKFSQQRFFRQTGSDLETGVATYEQIDLGDYVNRLFRLHTQIEAISEDKIMCGNYTTTITAKTPTADKKTLDFGSVKLPAHNDNITDYKSVYKLMLPFYGFVDVPNEYAGKEINLKYEINVITGGALAIISYDNIPFLFKEIEPKTDIIFKTNVYYSSDTAGSDKWNESVFFGLEPFILCEWYESSDYGRNSDRKRVIIGECQGFNIFDEIDQINNVQMTITEQTKIYDLLKQGVYIDTV